MMRAAFAFGADAVYAGLPRYSLRVRNNSFRNVETLREGIDEAHAERKKFFIVSNVLPHNPKVRSYLKDMAPIIALKPDALIMADPGLIDMVRETWPEMPVHLSVQANTLNWASVRFWSKLDVSRIILSRELSLDEIAEIRQECPETELEVFVHGALCIAYSGRCLLSGYFNHRDANQGACTNACRWNYKEVQHSHDQTGDLIATSADAVETCEPKEILLEEPNRPGGFIPAYEDEHGTYIMNSKDLRAVQHVAELVKMGVHSLKIEGRTKSTYYVARTTQVYRKAIDDALAGKPFDMHMMDELEALSNRGYTEGFLRRHVPQEYQTYEQGSSYLGTQQVVGTIADADERWLTIDVKNKFAPGDQLELITPAGNLRFSANTMENRHGEAMECAPGSGHIVKIPKPANVPEELDFTYLTKIFPENAGR